MPLLHYGLCVCVYVCVCVCVCVCVLEGVGDVVCMFVCVLEGRAVKGVVGLRRITVP